MSNKVDTVLLPHPPGECLSRETSACLNELYCVSVQKVTAGDQTWSVSCPSCPCSLCSPEEDQRGEGGDLAGEGALLCRGGERRGTAFHLYTDSHLHSHSSTPAPPTHVDVHPQYAVGGPVLVQWVPTSHFRL